ncbi:MAG TPA: hypothetical protein VLA19_31295 [Herpetosiphonaceae bacterium]|nr:hypothetical protein [Herpetosiphonaceae bacterium]
MPREMFEYHLETLTSRKEETTFEHFCRALAERGICPNLVPQSGPTGGGDSKVDTETYPVAEQLTERWYEGIGIQANSERWAFAFSAKKDWRAKVRSDVRNIAKTGREYRHIYFITNQFVPDRVRAQVEQKLAQDFGIAVHILDRTWIVKCVYEHDRLRLAIETLGLTSSLDVQRRETGPRDTHRSSELDELEAQISDPERYRGVGYQLIEDCLRAALLARGLERPRVDIDGRFDRAERLARRLDSPAQLLRVLYHRAWTTFWWFEDIDEVNRLYGQIEPLALDSAQAMDLERLTNLWQIVRASAHGGTLTIEPMELHRRTERLKGALERMVADTQRPNNAHQARVNRLLIALTESNLEEGETLDNLLLRLRDVLDASEGLVQVSVDSLVQIIQVLGDVLTSNANYDTLFEAALSLAERRASQGHAGILLLRRGYQQIDAGEFYPAIRSLGRSQGKLGLEEYHDAWVDALLGCARAYEAVGLFWAARANVLVATNQVLAEFWQDGTLSRRTITCVQALAWLELRLGRVPVVLQWIAFAVRLASELPLDGDQHERLNEEFAALDLSLGHVLLHADLSQLLSMTALPAALQRLGLLHARAALLYALGHEELLRSEGYLPPDESQEDVLAFFASWSEQPFAIDLPAGPDLLLDGEVSLHSRVLGCHVTAVAVNEQDTVLLAEAILGALEALLATSIDRPHVMPHRPAMTINVRPSVYVSGRPMHFVEPSPAGPVINVRHPARFSRTSPQEQQVVRSWLSEFLIKAMLELTVSRDPESFARQVFDDEQGLDRALAFADASIALRNLLGPSPRLRLSDWTDATNGPTYECVRTVPWSHGLPPAAPTSEVQPDELRLGEGPPPEALFNVRHDERQVHSLIDIDLWNAARWRGVGYVYTSEDWPIPAIALLFEDGRAAKDIFRGWLHTLGSEDNAELLAVTIITGIDRRHPAYYRRVYSE